MLPGDLAPTVFSTVGLPDARRIELWETHNATALIGLDVHARDPLEATELNVRLPRLQLARVAASAHVVERTAGVIDRSPADAIAVYLTLRGEAWFADQGGTRSLRPGNILICETDQPFARGFTRGLEELVIKVPREVWTARTDAAFPAGPVVGAFGGRDPYGQSLARVVGRAARKQRVVPAEENLVLDLVAALAAGRNAARAAAHRAAAKSFIEEHLTDASLGAGQVAAAIGISERQLSRIFAADGTSVPRHILARRLQLAYSILSHGATSHGEGATETVADVAARCGFTSVTYFSHAFRAHFGQRAGDVRRGSF
ncbi:MAG TPA: helix-turn-helix domain-containing protein [Trebonia sp.]